jgi:hypothetical protein
MKKMLFVVALVALLVPATFARTYLNTGSTMWNTDSNSPGNSTQATSPDRERDDDTNFEIKAENYNWPAEYMFVDAATIPVKMEIGYWIKFTTKDKVLKLKQMEIHKYAGTVDVAVECNTAIQVKVRFDKDSTMPTMNVDALYLGIGTATTFSDTIAINAPGATIRISLRLKDVDLKSFNVSTQVGKCIQVGVVTLSVRPQAKPSISGAC